MPKDISQIYWNTITVKNQFNFLDVILQCNCAYLMHMQKWGCWKTSSESRSSKRNAYLERYVLSSFKSYLLYILIFPTLSDLQEHAAFQKVFYNFPIEILKHLLIKGKSKLREGSKKYHKMTAKDVINYLGFRKIV